MWKICRILFLGYFFLLIVECILSNFRVWKTHALSNWYNLSLGGGSNKFLRVGFRAITTSIIFLIVLKFYLFLGSYFWQLTEFITTECFLHWLKSYNIGVWNFYIPLWEIVLSPLGIFYHCFDPTIVQPPSDKFYPNSIHLFQ